MSEGINKACPKVGIMEWSVAWACVHGGLASGEKKRTWSRVCRSFSRTVIDRSFFMVAYSPLARVVLVVIDDSKEIGGASINIYGQSIK